jgi:hypothetical protein
MDLDAGQAAPSQHPIEDHAVADVDRDDPELLDRASRKAGAHVRPDLEGTREALAELRTAADARPRELEGGPDHAHPSLGNGGPEHLGL